MILPAVIAALLVDAVAATTSLARQSLDAASPVPQAAARAPRQSASIAGRVIQADGAAAEGARIAVYAVREDAPAAVVATTSSSHDGRYEVSGLPAGQFVVGVTPQRVRGLGGDSRRLATPAVETLYPGTTDRMKAQPVTVFAGTATEGIDIWLEPAAQRYSISGRLFWPDDLSAENVVIEYGGPEGMHHGIWHVSDPGGLFMVEGAARGTYVLLARADTSAGLLMGIASTNVANDSVHDVRIALRQPGTIEGRLVIEGAAGPEPATLRLTATQTLLAPSPLYPVADVAPDADGRFTIPQLLGEFTLTVRGLPSGWRVRRISRGGTALPDNRLTVLPGERVTAIEVAIASSTTR